MGNPLAVSPRPESLMQLVYLRSAFCSERSAFCYLLHASDHSDLAPDGCSSCLAACPQLGLWAKWPCQSAVDCAAGPALRAVDRPVSQINRRLFCWATITGRRDRCCSAGLLRDLPAPQRNRAPAIEFVESCASLVGHSRQELPLTAVPKFCRVEMWRGGGRSR